MHNYFLENKKELFFKDISFHKEETTCNLTQLTKEIGED